MDVYLLPAKRGGHRLFSSRFFLEPAASDAAEPRKLWDALKETYDALTRKSRQTERFLRCAWELESITVQYPAALTDDEARGIYTSIVEEATRKHKKWLLLNGAALPFSAVLTIIPGPNLLLAYLAFRTHAHYKSQQGGAKLAREIPVDFVPNETLDRLSALVRRGWVFRRTKRIRALGEELGLPRLEEAY